MLITGQPSNEAQRTTGSHHTHTRQCTQRMHRNESVHCGICVYEIEKIKTWSFVNTMKEEMEKSLRNMATEIETLKTNITESKATAEKQRDKESETNNVILYKVTKSTAVRAEDRNKEDVAFCLRLFNNGLHAGVAE